MSGDALTQAALWVGALQLAGVASLSAAAIVDACARRRSAATRRFIWALGLTTALVLPLARLWLAAPSAAPAPTLAALALTLWAAGALALLMRLIHGATAAGRQVARATPLDAGPWAASLRALQDPRGRPRVELRVAEALASPVTVALPRPVILVPRAMLDAPPALRTATLAHETAHVARADCWLLVAGAIARALYWPNPLAWWALRRLREQAEGAADDAVLRAGVRSSTYAAELVALARRQLAARAATRGLRARVIAILDRTRPRSLLDTRSAPRWSAPRLIAVAVLLATAVTACEARHAPTTADARLQRAP